MEEAPMVPSFRRLFADWSDNNPCGFQKTLLAIFERVLSAFNDLVDLPYEEISVEMFNILIGTVSSPRKKDNMRYLVMMLDRYLEEATGKAVVHPSLSDDQAVWMVLHERSALDSCLIRDRVLSIAEDDLRFDVLGAKYLVSLYGYRDEETIGYRRKSILLCESLFGRELSDISASEVCAIQDNLPSWIYPMFACTIRRIFELAA